MISWVFRCTNGNPRWGSKVISRGRGLEWVRHPENVVGFGRQMHGERSRPFKQGQRGKRKRELPGEQTCQVWSVVGPAEPLRQHEEKSRREGIPGQKEQRLGKVGQGGKEAAVMSAFGSKGTQIRFDEQIREGVT